MMQEPLLALQQFISEEYNSQLGLKLLEVSSGSIPRKAGPTWQWQSRDLIAATAKSATGAVLLDEEIGLCIFVQLFSKDTDLRSQLAKALQIKSALRPKRQTSLEDVDPLGEWSVTCLWLSEQSSLERWIAEVASIRQQTSHFEEVSADILVGSPKNWPEACRSHGVPRLLFNVRSSLKRRKSDEATKWLTAEAAICGRLRNLPQSLPATLQSFSKELSSAIESGISSIAIERSAAQSGHPTGLHRVSIQNFRNVGNLSLELRDPLIPVAANIIQGPNGSGKSAISEAISIAVSRVSSRYIDFLNDVNEPAQGKANKYVQRYLSPIGGNFKEPKVGLNSDNPLPVSLAEKDVADQRYLSMSGSFLSQSWSENLLRMGAARLGFEVAGTYSSIVGSVVDFIEKRQAEAEGERASFNRQWGLRSNVSRDETARTKIVSDITASAMPTPHSALVWISKASQSDWKFKDDFRSCMNRWSEWQNGSASRNQTLSLAESSSALQKAFQQQMTEYNTIARLASDLVRSVTEVRAEVAELDPNFVADLRAWCSWLDIRSSHPTRDEEGERSQADNLQSELDKLTRRGRSISERAKSIGAVLAFTRDHWSNEHPNTCPICASDVSARNGISQVLEETQNAADQELQSVRQLYRATKEKLDAEIEKQRAQAKHLPPLQGEHLSRVKAAIEAVFGDNEVFEKLSDAAIRSNVFSIMELLENASIAAPIQRSDDEALRAADQNSRRLWEAFQKFEQISDAPDAWKSVLRRVYDELTSTIREHLPKTIQKLWWEIACNLMPAPWQYPGRIEFQVDQKRMQTEAKVVVRNGDSSPLAAHILNGAELHNLGLAWFFTRYLTAGRFTNSFLVMDDPAQQMDQPTFRDFCRFLAVLARLHAGDKMPLTLVIFLHQDERAIEAARMLDGTLHLLRWHSGLAAIEDRYKMRVSPILPIAPYTILKAS